MDGFENADGILNHLEIMPGDKVCFWDVLEAEKQGLVGQFERKNVGFSKI